MLCECHFEVCLKLTLRHYFNFAVQIYEVYKLGSINTTPPPPPHPHTLRYIYSQF